MQSHTQKLIDGLNDDLAGELQAVIQYIQYAASVTGIDRPQLAEFFRSEIPDELGHAQFLAEKVAALGGIPTTEPKPVPQAKTNREMLEAVLQAEQDAIRNYTVRLEQAEEAGDIGLRVQLEEHISDETGHMEEVRKLLAG